MRVIRPPDIYVGGLIFYRDSSFFFFRHLIAELTERNTTKIGHVLGIFLQFEHACPKPGVLPLQIGAQKTLSWTTSQFNGNSNGLYLRNETIGQVR